MLATSFQLRALPLILSLMFNVGTAVWPDAYNIFLYLNISINENLLNGIQNLLK